MGFSKKVKEDILVASARHCCVCRRYRGLKIEIHHITPQEQGGDDSFENAIALCFDCHADAGHYFDKHPKGIKLSPNELKKHKQEWLENVKANKIVPETKANVELIFCDNSNPSIFEPIFVEEKTVYRDINELKKIDYQEFVEQMKTGNFMYDFLLNKIESFDDFVSYLNGEEIKKYSKIDKKEETDPQPLLLSLDTLGHRSIERINLSTCVLNLKLRNNGPEIIENFKVYLNFENVIKADSVDKRKTFFDSSQYSYNVIFKDDLNGEFTPNSTVLVQSDSIDLDPICFKTKSTYHKATINWQLLANGLKQEGQINLQISPKIEFTENVKYVENPENHIETSIQLNKFEFK